MANSFEIHIYKQDILTALIHNEEIIKLIDADPKEYEYPDDLLDKYIFSYFKNPETQDEQKTCIFVYVDATRTTGRNQMLKDLTITIVCSTHKRMMYFENCVGNRLDMLSYLIDKQFNDCDTLGIGHLRLLSNIESNLDNNHPCRILKFEIQDFDDTRRELMFIERDLQRRADELEDLPIIPPDPELPVDPENPEQPVEPTDPIEPPVEPTNPDTNDKTNEESGADLVENQ